MPTPWSASRARGCALRDQAAGAGRADRAHARHTVPERRPGPTRRLRSSGRGPGRSCSASTASSGRMARPGSGATWRWPAASQPRLPGGAPAPLPPVTGAGGRHRRLDRLRAQLVRRFSVNQAVVAIRSGERGQPHPYSPDSSDRAYEGARRALVAAMIAAKDELRRLGLTRQIQISFNWAYRLDPASETSFWNAVGVRGPRVRPGARLGRPRRLPGHPCSPRSTPPAASGTTWSTP